MEDSDPPPPLSQQGNRKRSSSESDADRISTAVLNSNNQNVEFAIPEGLDVSISNPNISDQGSGLIDTPMGIGLGTRLRVRQNPEQNERKNRAEKSCYNLITDIKSWVELMSASPLPDLLEVNEGYQRFKRRIQRTTQEAILRRVSNSVLCEISGLQVRIKALKTRAERRDRAQLNNPPQGNFVDTNEHEMDDEVFELSENETEDDPRLVDPPHQNIEGITSDQDSNSNALPPPEHLDSDSQKLNRSALSSSIDQIICLIQDNVDVEVPPPPPLSLNSECSRLSCIEESIQRISSICDEINIKIGVVTANSALNSDAISALEKRVSSLDRDVKTYVDSKFSNVSQKLTSISLNMSKPRNVSESVESIKKELKDLKLRQQRDQVAMSHLSNTIANVKDQFDSSLEFNPSNISHNSSLSSSRSRRDKDNERELMKDSIESSARLIRQLTNVSVSMSSEFSTIQKSNNDVRKLNTYIKSCQDALIKYVAYDGYNQDYMSTIKAMLQDANDWILHVERIYSSSEAHAINTSKGDTTSIGVFSNNADKTVFEFFEEVELCLLGWGTGKQRATQLYNNHLSDDIKSQTIDISDNFSSLKKWMIREYGDPDTIVSEIVSSLSKKPKPVGDNLRERQKYFSNLCKSLARLDKLVRVPELDLDELDSILYSKANLRKLFETLPLADHNNLGRAMAMQRLDWRNPKGVGTFAVFKEFCDNERRLLEPHREVGEEKMKNKTVFQVESSTVPIVNPPTQAPPSYNRPRTQWFNSNWRFPCPLGGHDHELASCKEFLSLSPAEKISRVEKGRICYTCLKPRGPCKGRNCSRQDNIPQELICPGCRSYAQAKGYSPLSILVCNRAQHAELRAPYNEIRSKFEEYFGKLNGTINESNLKVSANFMHQAYTVNPLNRSVQGELVPSCTPIPTIDSQSGQFITSENAIIIPEVSEHAHYLMQLLKIGSSTVLAFYDRGANINLIDGEIAERENLKLTSDKPIELTVVGGGAIVTEYGQFSFNLGPSEDNKFHEINCTGMSSVTGDFNRYDLKEIVQEYYDSLLPGEPVEPVPEFTGGSTVKLLIGIKNTRLDPTLVKVLPSGIGVYKAPFKDVWGSRLIFAGPHQSFTQGNKGLRADVNHAVYKLRQVLEDTLSPKTNIPIKIKVDKMEDISIYPYPLSEQDLIDAGGITDDDELNPNRIEQLILDRKDSGRDWNKCGSHVARIPISKIRELIDQDDVDQLVTYRCNTCVKCLECKKSPRLTTISLQESREQELIEKSVRISLEDAKVIVDFPFLKNPTEFLTKKHGSSSNYKQAKRIYLSQCKKNEMDKIGTRMAHKELVERGFMVKLSELSDDSQKLINEAPFRHFYPWFIVSKIESISTPRRIVVDPSVTGLNSILPKGENRIGSLLDLIVRNRTKPVGWMSDVSKLYNQLELDESAYPFSLFLFHESLDTEIEPTVYVMLRAWYGVVQTGGQAGYALDRLADIGAEEFPKAKDCIQKNRYVDDIIPGANNIEEAEEQISQVKELLAKAGFSLKYVVRSGEPPGEKASSDGESVKMLGYKWKTVEDTLHPGIAEFNINKKIRGVQKPNEEPIRTKQDAAEALTQTNLTRRIIVSKIATLFDPLGLWEPLKLQLKLHSANLNSLPWDKRVPEREEIFWKTKLPEFVEYENLSANRCAVPSDEESTSGIRLICISDAGISAGGAAVYIGRKIKDGSWSCSLLFSKSRLMKATVPRNELAAILIMAELGYIARRSIGDPVEQILYFTDSTIALSWIHNTSIKLRAYTFARVEATRRLIQMTTGEQEIPIFHIDGSRNIADLLTKYHEVTVESLSIGSTWQQGEDWMKQDLEKMRLKTYQDLKPSTEESDEIKQECFQEPFSPETSTAVHTVQVSDVCDKGNKILKTPPPSLPVDIVRLGWERTIRVLNKSFTFIQSCLHNLGRCRSLYEKCIFCNPTADSRDNRDASKNALFRNEAIMIKTYIDEKRLKKFLLENGIFYFKGRLTEDNPFKFCDLDQIPFLDAGKIIGHLPVVREDSPILYALVLDIHLRRTPHAGVELTVNEVFKEVFVIQGLRRLIRRIKKDCLKCKLLDRKTVELQMSHHPQARTTIAPPFYTMMIDVAFGFKGQSYKKSRSTFKLYALVCVCILTGATSILVLEGLQTQDIVGALERHSSRHGVPAEVFVDNGTQLMALKEAEFSIRDIDTELHHSMGIKVHTSTAKSHEERGRVERKIRSLRMMLEKLGISSESPMTSLQWETTFAKIASMIDDLPLARGDSSSTTNLGYDILSPNRLKLGRNNFRSLDGGGINILASQIPTEILERNRQIVHCWYQLFIDNIHMLMLKPDKFLINSEPPKRDDIVLFTMVDGAMGKNSIVWKLGKVVKVLDRKAIISYITRIPKIGSPLKSELNRNFRDISILYSVGDLFINTPEHFNTYCGESKNTKVAN